MIVFPNCKINLGLTIVNKRDDGYHNIETVFYPLPLHDILEILPNGEAKVNFSSSGIDIPGDASDNLCVRAYQLLKEEFELPGVNIHLHKHIPMGAGLGGGSSDAAYTLKVLNDIFELKLTPTKLLQYASILGADCSFFMLNKPTFAYGLGNKFSTCDVNLDGCQLIIVKPEIHVGTAEAYAGVKIDPQLTPIVEILKRPIDDWKQKLVNDFEKSIFEMHPRISEIKNTLYKNGAVYASMSGSGSSVFGIFKKSVDLSSEFAADFYWSTNI